MEKRRRSPASNKKKMTKEQLQLAILKKKETDAKALQIVERLLEPDIDPAWLLENLKDINKCHMEDVIEERAIVKLCGYVLCQKPVTVVYNQRYHISLKDKKVYDVTKRQNFCSSSCYGASNYLLEQMLTSPLWLRDNEDIPKFKIFGKEKQRSKSTIIDTHGEEVDIAAVKNTQQNVVQNKEPQDFSANQDGQLEKEKSVEAEKTISGCIENFVLEEVQNFELKNINSNGHEKPVSSDHKENNDEIITETKDFTTVTNTKTELRIERSSNIDVTEKDNDKSDDDDVIEQCVYPIVNEITNNSSRTSKEKHIENEDIIDQVSYLNNDKHIETDSSSNIPSNHKSTEVQDVDVVRPCIKGKSKVIKQKKRTESTKLVDVNLAAKVEESFREWVTNQTLDYLFGDDSIKKKVINEVEIQETHRILCGKLDRLQFEEDREDAAILEKPALKPAPHFAVLKEEGEKLDLKVRAFYQGKTSFDEPPKTDANEEVSENANKFLPLDVHGPQYLRRKIFLEKLDQVLPDLLKTLAGNNDVYTRASLNYTSVKCSAVKALVQTFSLSAKNIIFKMAEWTLVGLVIIKMLSISDTFLASLLLTKQANLYVSMILTAYKLNSDYLNLLVTSFNPNMNPI